MEYYEKLKEDYKRILQAYNKGLATKEDIEDIEDLLFQEEEKSGT